MAARGLAVGDGVVGVVVVREVDPGVGVVEAGIVGGVGLNEIDALGEDEEVVGVGLDLEVGPVVAKGDAEDGIGALHGGDVLSDGELRDRFGDEG